MKSLNNDYLRICLILSVVALLFGCTTDTKTLRIDPKSLDFEDVGIDETVTKEITLTNKYGKDIQADVLALSGSTDFTIIEGGSVPVSIAKGADHIIKIAFIPVDAGIEEAQLEIKHDASSKSKFVYISGNGIPVPKIELAETSYDYSIKIINKAHTHDFVIENKGTDVLSVTSMNFIGTGASAYVVTAGDAPVDIPAKTTHTFTVTFSPTALIKYPTELQISNNAINAGNPDTITLDGEGVDIDPRINLSVGSTWDFGEVATTMPALRVCEIENTGIDPLTLNSATLTNNTEFTIDSLKDSNGNVYSFPKQVPVGDKLFLHVLFTPTSNISYSDTLSFDHNGTNEGSPLDIPLSGKGRGELTKIFSYTGAIQSWVVPAGVVTINAECYGAQGGDSDNGKGGKGGMAAATIPVTPGETLNFYVGQMGFIGLKDDPGGWNGGGGVNATGRAGTGGGASDIRRGSDLGDRLLVAGAGGGGGYQTRSGGNGGGLTGQDAPDISPNWPYSNGKGGTQTAGGAAGYYTNGTAEPGTFGLGGRGKGDGAGGGGGGGGWYGGGGGQFTGAGGGSSYYDANGNSNKSTQTGVRIGDGEIKIKY